MLASPKRRISIEDFYGTYLPELWDGIGGAQLTGDVALITTVTIGTGSDAAVHTIEMRGPSFATHCGGNDDALFACACNLEDWKSSVRGTLPRIVRLLEPRVRGIRSALASASAASLASVVQHLRKMPGVLHVEFTDDAGDVMHFDIRVAGGSGPEATIRSTDADLYFALTSGSSLAALTKSRLTIEGDAAYVIRLANAVDALR